jgi:hypothetical protein
MVRRLFHKQFLLSSILSVGTKVKRSDRLRFLELRLDQARILKKQGYLYILEYNNNVFVVSKELIEETTDDCKQRND